MEAMDTPVCKVCYHLVIRREPRDAPPNAKRSIEKPKALGKLIV